MRLKPVISAAVLILGLSAASAMWWYRFDIQQAYNQSQLPPAVSFDQIEQPTEDAKEPEVIIDKLEPTETTSEKTEQDIIPVTSVPDKSVTELPKTVNLAVPFTSQAPKGNWDLPYQEACEEASLIMVNSYYQKKTGVLDSTEVESEIARMVDFENAFFGTYLDTTVAQTSLLAEQFYGFENMEIIENPTVEDIKNKLAAGYPVIVPAAGQALGNPFFTPPGPLYHMLVIRGYTETGFITNDPGTRRGEAYVYSFDRLMSSIHDWNDGLVSEGQSVVLVLMPN